MLDEAVKSRVHATICYRPLNLDQTLQIFQTNASKLARAEEIRHVASGEPKLVVIDDQIADFARQHYVRHTDNDGLCRWNGRQIANAFLIATSLARYEVLGNPKAQPQLRASHFEQVERLTREYDRSRFKALGKSDSRVAQEWGERYDAYEQLELSVPRPMSRGQQSQQDQYPSGSVLPYSASTRMRLSPTDSSCGLLGHEKDDHTDKSDGDGSSNSRPGRLFEPSHRRN